MKRIIGYDIARAVSMFYIIAILHLSAYTSYSIAQWNAATSLIWSTLGVFTFLSSFLLGSKYIFEKSDDYLLFYKKRLLRFYPLFLISSILLVIISFNDIQTTIKGLLGISPYYEPQQNTLWYIAMLVSLYLVTPFLCVQGIAKQILRFIVIVVSILTFDLVLKSVDPRTYYYVMVFFTGLFLARNYKQQTIDILFNKKYFLLATTIWLFILCFITINGNRILMMLAGYVGMYVITSFSMIVSKKVEKINGLNFLVKFVSFASMCAYLFHREVYWFFLEIFNPKNEIYILLYLFFIGFPATMILSYYIQKFYDNIVKRVL